MNRSMARAAALAAFFAPAVLTAPRPARSTPGRDVEEIAASCRATGLRGWELVDEATRQVHEAFDHTSLWHLWEGSQVALANGRGWAAQYNGALMLVLRRLGIDARVVHAARVRGLGNNPWWQAGHSWLQVTVDGRTRDVCASRAENRAGQVQFVPVTPVRPMNRWTRALVSLSLSPVVAVQAWKQLAGAPVAPWLYRDFDELL